MALSIVRDKEKLTRAVVVVKWLACSPSTLTIRVRILLMPTVFSVKLVFEKTKINKKRPGWPTFLKRVVKTRLGSKLKVELFLPTAMRPNAIRPR